MTQTAKNSKSKPTAAREFVVTKSIGLLEFLMLEITNKSRNNVKSLLAHRAVSVDGNIITQYDYPLEIGQTVRLAQSVYGQRKSPLQIIFEDNDIIVINKPVGLLSVSTDNEKENTAYHMLTTYIRSSNSKGRIFVVHRLDRDTSGVLMFAKNERIKLALQDNWDRLVSQRGYTAVVEGQLEEKSGRIHSWLKQTKTLVMYSGHKTGDGLEATTNYKVIDETSKYSLVDVRLETGRKNQIRVHMKDLGHPVVGDRKYGAQTNPLNRLGLHANIFEFTHPFSGRVMHFEAETPKCFTALFRR